ncbi:MAG TPA: tyrosine-type recombinase/integrase [Actinocrinis sp.]|uniref:tyrosine-type recombinase/integrase n=1 Tax=Actinocrinis sp. TaxID=1920516 RepID=UPI002D6E142F|nr:tyrosine-type recombinase/integrase [Actinocrinis sp.]HZU56088.1 tyrosine-type recombinase/integrase [Actinocrinis sp.]
MSKTYDVRFYKIRKRDGRTRPFEVRWNVGGTSKSKSFVTRLLADNYRAKLMAAARAGEEFDTMTGEPASWVETKPVTCYEHFRAYIAMKWPTASAKNRSSLVDALSTVMPALLAEDANRPDAKTIHNALYYWAFMPNKPEADWPKDVAEILRWVAKTSLSVPSLTETRVIRQALNALSLKQDGKAAAANTVRRKRSVFYNALGYAVELDLLAANPIDKVQWTPPETAEEVDRRVVANPTQVRALLKAVSKHSERGRHLSAFFACLYFAAMRPSEAARLRLVDCYLPDNGWGRLDLQGSSPYAGTAWTDDGGTHDHRELKKRSRNAVRAVPIPPELVGILRAHIDAHGIAADGRLFRGARGGDLSSGEYPSIWRQVRQEALTAAQAASPLAARPYDLRHGGVSLWLNSGVSPTVVARRAGHGVAVLLKVYAGCLDGEDEVANGRIDEGLSAYGDDPDAGPQSAHDE